jgi:D-beta-D-heptose 7-phosphate kinase/D-beta-D-heptose 1-phosphate adenosyltransferase
VIDKVKKISDLKSIIAKEKKKGKKIVFTNGCFDLLHIGHVRYLEEARKFGDILVVAVNSDESVRKIKDRGRPIIGERERAETISAFQCVDYVVVFDEPDPRRIISELQPNLLVKGADYETKEIIGRDIIESLGGEVKTIPLTHGASTSKIIEVILNRYGKEVRR